MIEGHPAIVYDPEHQAKDPLYGQETMRHELEHAGVMESIPYQKERTPNLAFLNAGGEELRQRTSDIEQIKAHGPAAMRVESYRKQLRDATTYSNILIKSLSEKFNMTPDEVKSKVKALQADIDQAVKKREEKRQQENKPDPVKPQVGSIKPPVNPVGQSADPVDNPAELEPAQ
jgi:hypothetical protein